MSKHTPAPWTMERNEGYLINGIIHVPDVYEEHHADARLIAAAPELLTALDRLVLEAIHYRDSGAGMIHLTEAINTARAAASAARSQEAS